MILTLSGGIMARKLNILNKWPTTGTVAACIVVITCYAGNNSKFSGYLPHTGTSAVRIQDEIRTQDNFFELPPLSSEITKAELASVESSIGFSTGRTNASPSPIKREFTSSSELIKQTNTVGQIVVTPFLPTGPSRPLEEGFEPFISVTSKDILSSPARSDKISLDELATYFSPSGNRNSSTVTNSLTGRKTP